MKNTKINYYLFCFFIIISIITTVGLYDIIKINNSKIKEIRTIKPKFIKSENVKNRLEAKIIDYLQMEKIWHNGEMKPLSEGKCKEIAKAVIKTKYPMITVGIISIESGFNRKAKNKTSGCVGLGQIHPVHKKELKRAGIIDEFSDLYNIKNNVEAINFVFNQKLDITHGDIKKALQLYSGGARNYHKKVLGKTKDIKDHFSES